MNGWVVFIIILLLALIGGYGGWVVWSRLRAKRLGLSPPSLLPFARSSPPTNFPAPAPGGIRGWIDTQVRKFKNRNNRYATGAYEEPSTYAGGGRARGAGHRLDPDEAWDARVGNEAYYEEQELGLHAPQGGNGSNTYGGGGYGAPEPGVVAQEPERGRSRTREYDERTLDDGRSGRENPFGDENAASLRGVSPRPLDQGQDTSYGGAQHQQPAQAHAGDSPTERRSMFRENM
ncbi:uncharacterized protein BDR25DRAFT_131265 [Lindgomyces ingoldianus]|uniref:Uncharacterized protein n=1 Tax=Lindgomyces ingoldianus TaxID=673940 RepID=A0ACB6R2H7_9PLEO|nr:uncharacterized protein BDR25DRAFT_131265 [Lindgomyces ingoldianus]KAF2473351.1 hypothetical protein BDR25DRAFT_131265 [Lindgomyces ingoldianus]